MDQSDDSMAAAPDFVEAVLAELEVAVLLCELVLEAENVHTGRISAFTVWCSVAKGREAYLHEVALETAAAEPTTSPLLVPPVSPLPLEPIGD